uniref:Probable methyltransferase PMT5 n=1 Tax=Tanacetum cinerariifolium TaxID=118510 RepID=A0A699HGI1_TANCI|nr:probable methyltransferase PMT5 [Tanacetum cinerariifolium]
MSLSSGDSNLKEVSLCGREKEHYVPCHNVSANLLTGFKTMTGYSLMVSKKYSRQVAEMIRLGSDDEFLNAGVRTVLDIGYGIFLIEVDRILKPGGYCCVSSILVSILPLSHSSPSYLRTAISNYGMSLGRSLWFWLDHRTESYPKHLMTSESS